MKAIAVSGSPRKKWNTAVLLQKKPAGYYWPAGQSFIIVNAFTRKDPYHPS
jgi:hypothetical protein